MVHRPRTVEHSRKQPAEGSLRERIDHDWAPSSATTLRRSPTHLRSLPRACRRAKERCYRSRRDASAPAGGRPSAQTRDCCSRSSGRVPSLPPPKPAPLLSRSASVHVRTLESATGQGWWPDTDAGVVSTAAGKVVASHADRVLATLDSMRRTLEALDGRNVGELVVAASLTPACCCCPGSSVRMATSTRASLSICGPGPPEPSSGTLYAAPLTSGSRARFLAPSPSRASRS